MPVARFLPCRGDMFIDRRPPRNSGAVRRAELNLKVLVPFHSARPNRAWFLFIFWSIDISLLRSERTATVICSNIYLMPAADRAPINARRVRLPSRSCGGSCFASPRPASNLEAARGWKSGRFGFNRHHLPSMITHGSSP